MEKTLILERMKQKEKTAAGDERFYSITNSMNKNMSRLWRPERSGKPGMLQSMRFQELDLT